jgi:hypothetical protein
MFYKSLSIAQGIALNYLTMKRIVTSSLVLLFALSFRGALSHAETAPYEPYGALLKKVAAEDGVRWNLFGPQEKGLLASFLSWAGEVNPLSLGDRNDQLAFWLNAHNACVMKLISERLPVEDVMSIAGFRDRLKCRIAGSDHSLVEVESRVIRPLFNEPRTRFLLWWGVRGGPRLASVPYEGKTLENVLEKASRKALADPAFVRFDPAGPKPMMLSPMFEWYKRDFGPKEGDLLAFIRARLPKEEAGKVPSTFSKVSFGTFDWTLDSAK